MKKLFLLIVFSTLIVTASFGATIQRTILSHNGKLTQYDLAKWQGAINDAVAGDTVYFTPGFFQGDITITKPITLIGAGVAETDGFWYGKDINNAFAGCGTSGSSTTLTSIYVDIPDNVMLTATLLEGIRLSEYCVIRIIKPLTNLTFKRCQMDDWVYCQDFDGFSPKTTNPVFEDCFIGELNCLEFENPDIHNCYIHKLRNASEIELLNCVVIEHWNCTNNTFVNCITSDSGASTFINCVLRGNEVPNSPEYTNCWAYNEAQCLTVDQLTINGFLGIDGTVVGPRGGVAQFTLIPAQPYVTSGSATYIKSQKKLNVNVTVKQGK